MKTIRQNTFETNSSSTHSISIVNRNDNKNNKNNREINLPLVDDEGYLLYYNLKTYASIFGEYSVDFFLLCDTKDKKSAIFVHWLLYKFDCVDEEYDKVFSDINQIVKDYLGYTGIKNKSDKVTFGDYGPYAEKGDDMGGFLDWGNWQIPRDREKIKKFIDDVILNDNMIIEDSDVEN